jgi:hypothetical protein
MSKPVVTICPPGAAADADYLTRWAYRRRARRSGVPEKRDPEPLDAAEHWLAEQERCRQGAKRGSLKEPPRREAEAADQPWMRDRPPWRR